MDQDRRMAEMGLIPSVPGGADSDHNLVPQGARARTPKRWSPGSRHGHAERTRWVANAAHGAHTIHWSTALVRPALSRTRG